MSWVTKPCVDCNQPTEDLIEPDDGYPMPPDDEWLCSECYHSSRRARERGVKDGIAIAAGIIALGEWARRCGSQLCRECNGSMRGGWACHPDGTRTCISCMHLRERGPR